MTIQQMADIAARHFTRMADAMIAACVALSLETGEALRIPERAKGKRARATYEDAEARMFERMVRTNSDTRSFHM